MVNLNAFLGYFLSYLIVFVVFVVLVIAACMIGIKWRKAKDAKAALTDEAEAVKEMGDVRTEKQK